jgi:hypothetical protein
MADKVVANKEPRTPFRVWAPIVLVGWLVPGGGHFIQKRTMRGALLLLSVAAMFFFGLAMRGPLFQPQGGDLLTTIIYCGGYIAPIFSGAIYGLTTAFGYSQPDVAGHVHDYGTKFLVAAGLLNILAMVDAYEIATGKKD